MRRPDTGEPVFAAPWQAQAFALMVALRDRGAFSAAEWTAALSARLAAAPPARPDEQDDAYYQSWLEALGRLLAEKRLVAPEALAARAEAWRRAADATPHGAPILLANDPLGGAPAAGGAP